MDARPLPADMRQRLLQALKSHGIDAPDAHVVTHFERLLDFSNIAKPLSADDLGPEGMKRLVMGLLCSTASYAVEWLEPTAKTPDYAAEDAEDAEDEASEIAAGGIDLADMPRRRRTIRKHARAAVLVRVMGGPSLKATARVHWKRYAGLSLALLSAAAYGVATDRWSIVWLAAGYVAGSFVQDLSWVEVAVDAWPFTYRVTKWDKVDHLSELDPRRPSRRRSP